MMTFRRYEIIKSSEKPKYIIARDGWIYSMDKLKPCDLSNCISCPVSSYYKNGSIVKTCYLNEFFRMRRCDNTSIKKK